ncbi:hypothetical protein BJ085DRAFT_27925 [Dimargaris cristalligena]|uniref:Uncharacterized protein n=1 Tax=Dimargaris cristalligena TaxID=215637 RepID=A0A4P9ZNC8_9FUNG|nr:hypothetical protein BJ085DRAFT_27925 [Dimargaris cristalligena]|eukprot:RKP34827.1 hypothetical protein BJ085DRAFT_27925 [Dimargaris cristalligena]
MAFNVFARLFAQVRPTPAIRKLGQKIKATLNHRQPTAFDEPTGVPTGSKLQSKPKDQPLSSPSASTWSSVSTVSPGSLLELSFAASPAQSFADELALCPEFSDILTPPSSPAHSVARANLDIPECGLRALFPESESSTGIEPTLQLNSSMGGQSVDDVSLYSASSTGECQAIMPSGLAPCTNAPVPGGTSSYAPFEIGDEPFFLPGPAHLTRYTVEVGSFDILHRHLAKQGMFRDPLPLKEPFIDTAVSQPQAPPQSQPQPTELRPTRCANRPRYQRRVTFASFIPVPRGATGALCSDMAEGNIISVKWTPPKHNNI